MYLTPSWIVNGWHTCYTANGGQSSNHEIWSLLHGFGFDITKRLIQISPDGRIQAAVKQVSDNVLRYV